MPTVKLRFAIFKNRVAGVANLHASRKLKKVATHALIFLGIISWTSLPARLKLINFSILNIPYLIYFIEHCSWKIYNCGAIESQVMIIFIAQVYTFIRLETICKDRGGSLAGNFFYLHFTKYNNWLKPFWIKIWTFNQLQFQKSFFLKFKYHDVSLFSILWFLFKSGL